jgi:hypothetical protein
MSPRGRARLRSLAPHRAHAARRVLLATTALGALVLPWPTIAAGAVGRTASTVPASPNILTNGSFALRGGPAFFDLVTIQAPLYKSPYPLLGWVVGGGGVIISGEYVSPPPGVNQSVVLEDVTSGSVTQTVKTTPGWSYRLSWYSAGEPGPDTTPFRAMRVLWDSTVVAAPSFKVSDKYTSPVWGPQHVTVTANSALSTVEFADATAPADLGNGARSSMVAEVSLAGIADLYLPPTAVSTGNLVAVVRTPSSRPLNDPSLKVRLYGTWKTGASAAPTSRVIATATVVDGQAVLRAHLPASLAHQTIPAYATLSGPGFLPVTAKTKIVVA